MDVKNLIIGAGVSGLSIARYLDEPNDTLIVSKDIGGLITDFRVGDFLFGYGGHVYTSQDEETADIMKEAKGEFHEERKAYYLFDGDINGRLAEFPVQSSGFFPIEPTPRSEREDLKAFAMEKFGEIFAQQFFIPFNERVWQEKCERMSSDWIETRVQVDAKKKWGKNSSFWCAPGDNLIEVLKGLGNVPILLGTMVSVNVFGKEVGLVLSDTFSMLKIRYQRLFDTTGHFVNRIGQSAYQTAIGVGLKHEIPHDFHWLYTNVDCGVHRINQISKYHSANAPAGKTSLLIEVPHRTPHYIPWFSSVGADGDQFSLREIAWLALAAAGLKVADISDFEEVWTATFKSMPIQTLGLREEIAKIKRVEMTRDIFMSGRWGTHGYFNFDDILRDAKVAVEVGRGNKERIDEYLTSSFYYRKH